MPTFEIDDQACFHAKVLRAGNEAFGAWCRAGSWAMANLTDGYVTRDVTRIIAGDDIWYRLRDCGLPGPGLVEEVEGGWQIHDWQDWQRTAAEIRKHREQQAIRQKNRRALARAQKPVTRDVPRDVQRESRGVSQKGSRTESDAVTRDACMGEGRSGSTNRTLETVDRLERNNSDRLHSVTRDVPRDVQRVSQGESRPPNPHPNPHPIGERERPDLETVTRDVPRDTPRLTLEPPEATDPKKPKTVKTLLPADWAPSATHYQQAMSEGGKTASWVEAEAKAMRDWADSKGERCVNWDARFRNWIRRGMDMAKTNGPRVQPVQPGSSWLEKVKPWEEDNA